MSSKNTRRSTTSWWNRVSDTVRPRPLAPRHGLVLAQARNGSTWAARSNWSSRLTCGWWVASQSTNTRMALVRAFTVAGRSTVLMVWT